MNQHPDLSVALLHDQMLDKQGKLITASLTLIDLHDIARSGKTYGVREIYIAHTSPTLRKLAETLKQHWEEGFGATYNPNRKEALELIQVVHDLEEVIARMQSRTGRPPRLVATSARNSGARVSFEQFRNEFLPGGDPFLLMLGTGWGMSEDLLARAEFILEPLKGPGEYNHLSVRSACAVMLDRLLGGRDAGSHHER